MASITVCPTLISILVLHECNKEETTPKKVGGVQNSHEEFHHLQSVLLLILRNVAEHTIRAADMLMNVTTPQQSQHSQQAKQLIDVQQISFNQRTRKFHWDYGKHVTE